MLRLATVFVSMLTLSIPGAAQLTVGIEPLGLNDGTWNFDLYVNWAVGDDWTASGVRIDAMNGAVLEYNYQNDGNGNPLPNAGPGATNPFHTFMSTPLPAGAGGRFNNNYAGNVAGGAIPESPTPTRTAIEFNVTIFDTAETPADAENRFVHRTALRNEMLPCLGPIYFSQSGPTRPGDVLVGELQSNHFHRNGGVAPVFFGGQFFGGLDCAGAGPINLADTSDAPAGADESSCGTNDTLAEWWCFTPDCSGVATASTVDPNAGTFPLDTVLAVYSQCRDTELACNDDFVGVQSQVSWPVTAGTTYQVRVAGWQGTSGPYRLTLSCAPAGDTCAIARTANIGANSGETATHTASPIAGSCGVGDTIDEWWVWTAPTSGPVSASTCGAADFDTTLTLLNGCGDGNEIACNDDAPGCAGGSFISWNANAGTSYYLRIAGVGGAVGNYTLNLGRIAGDECHVCVPLPSSGPTTLATDGGSGSVDRSSCDPNRGDVIDQWSCWVAPCSGQATATVSFLNRGGTVSIFDDCNAPELACGSDSSAPQATWDVVAGRTYRVRVACWDGLTNEYTVDIACEPRGACCLPDGSCLGTIDAATCQTGLGGVYQGDGVACVEIDCLGACCLRNGTCLRATFAECFDPNRAIAGVSWSVTLDCNSVGCAPITGACCLPDGSCVDANRPRCESLTALRGIYQGDGVACNAVTCGLGGACCLGSDCVLAFPAGCAALNGSFLANGTACGGPPDPNGPTFSSPCCPDIDGSNGVDLADLSGMLGALGARVGDARYNQRADIDQDGEIKLPDLAGLLAAFGEICP